MCHRFIFNHNVLKHTKSLNTDLILKAIVWIPVVPDVSRLQPVSRELQRPWRMLRWLRSLARVKGGRKLVGESRKYTELYFRFCINSVFVALKRLIALSNTPQDSYNLIHVIFRCYISVNDALWNYECDVNYLQSVTTKIQPMIISVASKTS